MKIIDAHWTPVVNVLVIECEKCGHKNAHRADRWKVRCNKCGNTDNLRYLRERYEGCKTAK